MTQTLLGAMLAKLDLVGTDVRQWKRCMVPIAVALRDLAKA